MNAFFIEGIEKYAPDRLRIANIVQYFIDKQLSFPVRVTGIDQGIGLFYELADDLELFFARRADQKFPLPGYDRQVFRTPRFVAAVIILRFCLLQDVAVRPSHDTTARTDISIATLLRCRQAFGQFPGHTWFFSYKQRCHYITSL